MSGAQDDVRRDAWHLWHAWRGESQRVASLEAELHAMRGSRSWRITAPLRRAVAWWQSHGGAGPARPQVARPASTGAAWSAADLRERAPWLAFADTAGNTAKSRLFVDVTALALVDHGGGIQRVVERILVEWLRDPPATHAVVPVRLDGDRYVAAQSYACRVLGLPAGALGADAPVDAAAGDVFVGLDLVRDHARDAAVAQQRLRAGGASIAVVLYDLLPRRHPEWFPDGVPARFDEWIERVARPADRVACISAAVQDEWRELAASGAQVVQRFPLGGDFRRYVPHVDVPLPAAARAQRILMVGTLEPRKGHDLALDAMERLWAQGVDVHLVIAGREGWHASALAARLRGHPEAGRRLHVLPSVSDTMLANLYRACGTLLMASRGEGFGLPIVEAMQAGCHVVGRDLPVFREVAGDAATYFSGDDATVLAALLRDAMARTDAAAPARIATWAESAAGLLEACGVRAQPIAGPFAP